MGGLVMDRALILGEDGAVISTPQPGLWMKMENRNRALKHENRLLKDELRKYGEKQPIRRMALEHKLGQIAALHHAVRDGDSRWCKTCGEDYPCPTAQIIQRPL
jgi:hypothetical protein